MRHVDVLVLVLALPIFALAELSLTGYSVAAGAWLLQKGLAIFAQRRADASSEPKVVVGWLMFTAVARAWLCGIMLLAAGLIDERAGLAATLLVLLLFTVYITVKFVERGISAISAP